MAHLSGRYNEGMASLVVLAESASAQKQDKLFDILRQMGSRDRCVLRRGRLRLSGMGRKRSFGRFRHCGYG